MLKQIRLLILSIFIITGCTKTIQNNTKIPNVSNNNYYSTKKIGYIINVKPYPTHTHIGTTKLTNFVKKYRYDWQIPQYIEQELIKNLSRLAYVKPINLKKYGITPNEVNGLITYQGGKSIIEYTKADIYKKLRDNLDIDAIIVINELPKTGINNCNLLGCKEYKAQGYGVLSKGFLNTTDYYSATPFWIHIYKLKPNPQSLDPKIIDINGAKEMTKVAISKSHQMQPNKIGLKAYPKNFKNWTQEELAPFKLPLLSYIDALTKKISSTLLNAL